MMIADPCNAPLTPGLYGDMKGFTSRFRQNHSAPSIAGHTSGYVLWCPDFYGLALFTHASANSAVGPANRSSGDSWFGNGGSGYFTDTGYGRLNNSPAHAFVESSVCKDARTIGACLQIGYTGPMQDAGGEIAYIENVPLSALLGDNKDASATTNAGLSVDQLFHLTSRTQRFGTDTYEHVYRPTTTSTFIADNVYPSTVTDGFRVLSNQGKDDGPTVFGFAWRGVKSTGTGFLSIHLTQNIEWRPNTAYGIGVVETHTLGESKVQTALAQLDKTDHNWSRRVVDEVRSASSRIATAAFTGALNKGVSYLERSAMAALL